MKDETIIKIQGLSKRFGEVLALNGLSLEVKKRDIYGFLGPNGSGKSTTIRIITSLVKGDSGSVEVFGLPLKTPRKQILSRIGALVERPDFYENLTALKNLEILAGYSGLRLTKTDFLENLKLVGLKERASSKVKTFSEGMKQRLGIGQALLNNPELLILDEPFNSLDPQGVKDIRDLIVRLNREQGMTILLSSHKLDEVEKYANRMVLIDKGKAVAEGSVRELTGKGLITLSLESDKPDHAFQLLKNSELDIRNLRKEGEFVKLACDRIVIPDVNNLLVTNGAKVYRLSGDHLLEDFFLSFTEEKSA